MADGAFELPGQFFTTLEQNLQGLAATKLHGTSTE
jgi:hypothetical protein